MATSSNTKQLKVDILVKEATHNGVFCGLPLVAYTEKLLKQITKNDILIYAQNAGIEVSTVSTKIDMIDFCAMGIINRDKARQ